MDEITAAKNVILIELLKLEIKALRSVLSEFEGDKSNLIQMVRADDLAYCIEQLDMEL